MLKVRTTHTHITVLLLSFGGFGLASAGVPGLICASG